MEGGVEKILSFSYLVYVIIGLAIGLAIDKLVEYVKIVLSYQETLNSLKDKVEDLTTIIPLLQKQYPSDDIERQGSSAESAVEKWVVKLRHLHRDASAMEQNIARINIARTNVVSRYRASKEMKQKISEMEKHLKLFPLIQLELILRVLILTRRIRAADLPRVLAVAAVAAEKLPPALIKRAAKSILRRMKMVIYFNREVASLKDLVTSITPIIDEISEIPRLDVYPAINGWCEKMRELDEKAEKIESLPWWNVIRRYKDTKDVENLISTIEAHVKSASLISLEPLFQVKMDLESSTLQLGQSVNSLEPLLQERVDLESSSQESSSLEPRFQEMVDLESSSQEEKLRPSPQVVETFIEVDASNDEGLRAPQEVEASTGEGLVMKWKPLHISN